MKHEVKVLREESGYWCYYCYTCNKELSSYYPKYVKPDCLPQPECDGKKS